MCMRMPGPGVDLADRAAGVAVALGDVGGQEVDAADVEPDGADRPLGHQPVVGVDHVGHVDRGAAGREVGGLAQEHHLALRRHAAVVVALRLQQPVGGVVELEPGQHVLVAGAAAGVAVHLLDELGDRRAAVADDVAGHPAGGGDELAVDDQQPVVVALDHALDDDARAFVDGDLEGVGDLGVGRQVHRDAAAVVAVDRLDDHRVADVVRRVDRVLGVADVQLLRHRQPEVGEEPGAELLVAGDLDGGVRGLAGQRRLDPLLVLALADLDQARVVQPHPGDVAGLRRADQRQRRGPERAAAGEIVEVVDRLGDVEAAVLARGDQLEDDAARHLAGLEPDLLGLVAEEHLDLLGMRRGPGEGGLGRGAGAVLQRDRDLRHQLAEPAVRLAQPLGQRPAVLGPRVGEARELVEQRREVVGVVADRGLGAAMQVDGQADQRQLGVDVGADVDGSRNDLHGLSPLAMLRPRPLLAPARRGEKADCGEASQAADSAGKPLGSAAMPEPDDRAMRRQTIVLPGVAPGVRREITVLGFGRPGARPKAYLQAGLHADELPGMLVLRELGRLLAGSQVTGEVVVVPVANPVGLGQQVQGYLRGRYEANTGANFNRGYADLAVVGDAVEDELGPDAAANVAAIRAAMRAALAAAAPVGEMAALRHALLGLAHDADLVLDLHADNQAAMHLYVGTPLWPQAADLAAELGAEAVLLAEVSGRQPVRRGLQRAVVGARPALPRGADPAGLPCRDDRATLEQRRRRSARPRGRPGAPALPRPPRRRRRRVRAAAFAPLRGDAARGDAAADRAGRRARPLPRRPRRPGGGRRHGRRDRRPALGDRCRSRRAPPACSSPATTSPTPGPARSSARSPAASRCRSGRASF